MEKLIQILQQRNQRSLAEKSAKWGLNFAYDVPKPIQDNSDTTPSITWKPVTEKRATEAGAERAR